MTVKLLTRLKRTKKRAKYAILSLLVKVLIKEGILPYQSRFPTTRDQSGGTTQYVSDKSKEDAQS